MSHPLSRIPFLGQFVDERFLEHRRRSTSVAGLAGALVTGAIFEYKIFAKGIISWDLLAILVTMVVVKMTLMIWYKVRD
ncbi:MAG TPA: hypothetical protein VHW46_07170 [Terracidiphilus sp.]|jgi:hypothetical protein|nr:hypothetical protein [Terracidiphilus sp.]